MDEPINLNELDFSFAVENIEPNIGRIEAYQVHWGGQDGIKRKIPIKLVPCNELAPLGIPVTTEYTRARIGLKNDQAAYLCPDQSEEMEV